MIDILKESGSSSQDRPNAAKALPDAVIAQAFDKEVLTRLGTLDATGGLALIVKVPSESWCSPIENALGRLFRHVETQSFRRTRRPSAKRGDVESLLISLGTGSSTIAISATPEDSIADEYHTVADKVIAIEQLDVKVVRRVIRRVTGESAKGLTQAHLVGVGLYEAMAAIGSGGSAEQCVARLQRIRERKTMPADLAHIPSLDRLPLVGPVRQWTDDLMSDLARLDAGTIDASSIRFGTLEGPPGTGKSLLAAAIAKSSGWRFHKTTVQDWFNAGDGHLGAVTKACASFIDNLLAEDRCIGFIDEVQSIPNRITLDARGRDWWMPVVDGILVQIDRVRQSGKKILLLGACNHYDMLDAALIRPGRLETRITVLPPSTLEEAAAVLAFYAGDRFAPDDLEALAGLAVGSSPAAIEAAMRQAEASARRADRALTTRDLVDLLAPDGGRDADKLMGLALHEAGHAVLAHRLGMPVVSVTVIPKGDTAGSTTTGILSTSPSAAELESMILVQLAGRAADELLGQGADSGAAGDLASATQLLVEARTNWGLYGKLTAGSWLPANVRVTEREPLGDWVEAQLTRLMDRCRDLVAENEIAIRGLAAVLIERKVLHADAITKAIEDAEKSVSRPASVQVNDPGVPDYDRSGRPQRV